MLVNVLWNPKLDDAIILVIRFQILAMLYYIGYLWSKFEGLIRSEIRSENLEESIIFMNRDQSLGYSL